MSSSRSYREQPALSKTLEPNADWRPALLADLWRSARFSVTLKAGADMVDQVLSAVKEVEEDLKRLSATGEISDSESRQVLRALDFIIHGGRESVCDGFFRIGDDASRT